VLHSSTKYVVSILDKALEESSLEARMGLPKEHDYASDVVDVFLKVGNCWDEICWVRVGYDGFTYKDEKHSLTLYVRDNSVKTSVVDLREPTSIKTFLKTIKFLKEGGYVGPRYVESDVRFFR